MERQLLFIREAALNVQPNTLMGHKAAAWLTCDPDIIMQGHTSQQEYGPSNAHQMSIWDRDTEMLLRSCAWIHYDVTFPFKMIKKSLPCTKSKGSNFK